MEQTLQHTFPSGGTPLMKHLVHIHQMLAPMAQQLRQGGKRVTIVLATDGLPSTERDENQLQLFEFMHALRSLESLPVWIVVRLCTDNEKVFDFYNSIDAQLNLPYDVLDDFVGEAREVYLYNPWLTYGLPLHRLRELGIPHPIIDAIDEHALSLTELHSFCSMLFATPRPLPNPVADWDAFMSVISVAMRRERPLWNPVTKMRSPWIDLALLDSIYTENSRPTIPRPFAHTRDWVFPQSTSKKALLKDDILMGWALEPPHYQILRPLDQLLATLQINFPPAHDVAPHVYFQEFKPFAPVALASRDAAVLKLGK